MRNLAWYVLAIIALLAAAPAYGDSIIADVAFTLSPNIGTGSPSNLAPDPGPPCLAYDCVLFYGTLTDTDVSTDPSYPYMVLYGIDVSFSSNPASGSLTVDNTFYDSTDYVPGVLSGDPDYADDGSGNPPNSYTGAIFGIDIAPGTALGVYTGTVTISAAGGLDDPDYSGFAVSRSFTVDVAAPEPAAGSLSLAGLAALMACYGVKRKWLSSEAR
jgi:hypothetical protein